MEILSTEKLASIVSELRNKQNMTQSILSNKTGIKKDLISRIEKNTFIPSIKQLEALSEALDFDVTTLYTVKKVNNSTLDLKSEVLYENEKQGIDKLFTMMTAIRQQILIRKSFEKGNL